MDFQYRILIQRNGGESERLHVAERQVIDKEILDLVTGERVVVRKINMQPSAAGPGVIEAEPADTFNSG